MEPESGNVTDRNTVIEMELASLVDIHGLSLLDESGRLRRLLLQACPDAPRQVAVIASALSAGVPARLRGAKDDGALPALLQQQVDGLQTQGLLDRDWSVWAVRAWAHALALPTRSLDGPGPTAAPAPRPPAPSPFAGLWSPRPSDEAALPAVPAGRARLDKAPDDAALDSGSADGATAPLVEPLFSEEDLQRIARSGPAPRVRGTRWAARDEEPTGFEPPVAVSAPVRPEPILAPDDLRPAPRDEPETTTSGRLSPRLVIAGLLAIVVGSAGWIASRDAGLWTASPAFPSPSATTGSAMPRAAPADASAGAKGDPGGGATAGNPRSPAPTIASATPPPIVDPAAAPQPGPAAAPPPDAVDPAPTPAAPAPVPADPRIAARAPAIARIDVPSVVEGAPFAVAVHLATDLRDVASIERRVVSSSGPWVRAPAMLPIANLRRDGRDAVLVPFRAMDATARATVEFTAVARDGSRSAPKSASIAVVAPTRPAAARVDSASCTPATCGTVVEAREIEPEIGTRPAVYQIVVRLGDQRTLAFRAPYRFQSGSRVRSADGRFVPVD